MLSGCSASGIAYPLAVGISILLLTFYSGCVLRERFSGFSIAGIMVVASGITLLAWSNLV